MISRGNVTDVIYSNVTFMQKVTRRFMQIATCHFAISFVPDKKIETRICFIIEGYLEIHFTLILFD